MTIGIYKITNNINGKVYIGQSKNIERRFSEHKNRCVKKSCKTILYLAYDKYGFDNFSFEIIEECTIENLDTFEKYYIAKYKSNIKKYGYNLTSGGLGYNGKFTVEHKLNMSQAKLGKNNPLYGKSPTKETLEKRSESLKKVKHTKEWHAKIGAKHKGKVLSDETKEKIRQKLLGNKLSDETRAKMSEAQKERQRLKRIKKG